MRIGISSSEIQFISPLDSLTNLCLHSCSLRTEVIFLFLSAVLVFFLNYSEFRQGGRSSYLFGSLEFLHIKKKKKKKEFLHIAQYLTYCSHLANIC